MVKTDDGFCCAFNTISVQSSYATESGEEYDEYPDDDYYDDDYEEDDQGGESTSTESSQQTVTYSGFFLGKK